MNLTKRIVSFAVVFAMALVLLPASLRQAQAAEFQAKFEAQFDPSVNETVGEWPDLGDAATVTANSGAEATITLTFDAPVAFGGNYAAVSTSYPFSDAAVGRITSFKLDDKAIDMGAAYLNNEGIDGGLRLTITNKWNSDIATQPVDVGTLGQFSKLEVTFVVDEGGAAETAETIEPTFAAEDGGAYTAAFSAQLNPEVNETVGEWPDLGDAAKAEFTLGAESTISLSFDAPVAFGGNYAAVDTNYPFTETANGKITSFKLDGNEIAMGDAYLNNEGTDGGLRLTITNKWNSDILEQPVDAGTLGEFSTMDITFVVTNDREPGDAPAPAAPVSNAPAFEPGGVYHAYLGLQTQNYIFRNAWGDASYGENGVEWANQGVGNNFTGLTGWDGSDAVVFPGTFTDVEIAGNGTYQVSADDVDFGADEFFNLMFFSTDIPLADNPLSFSDIKVKMGGATRHTYEKGYVSGIDNSDARDYYEVQVINTYNADLGGADGLFGYTMPNGGNITIEFTVSGFNYDKAVDDTAAATDTAPASEFGADYMPEAPEATPEPAPAESGGVNWVIVGVIAAVCVCAAVVFVRSRKKNG